MAMVALQSTMCRLCLQADSEPSTVSIFSIANGHVIADIVERCLGIRIVKDSTPYENICSPCIVSLVSMNELYLKYQECNRTFLKLGLGIHQKDGEEGENRVHAGSPIAATELEDIIEEDYSISDDTEQLEISDEVKDPSSDANFDEPVYYLQDFGGCVSRQPGEMESLLHVHLGPHQHQHTDESEWNHPNGPLNESLMEELSAQVARLDGQDITDSKAKASADVRQSSPVLERIKEYPERAHPKDCCPEDEKLDEASVAGAAACQEAPASEAQCYQDPKHHCYICETSFQNDIELVNHFPVHFLDVPQDCALCGTQHRTVMNLNRHMAYHQPARPYKCDHCQRRFADPHTYRWHTSEFHSRQPTTHSAASTNAAAAQSLVCDICGKVYMLAEPYEQHVQQHEHGHQQYTCKLCARTFSRNIYLLFHLETHAKKRPHHCQHCSLSFASLYLKNFHEKRHPSDDGGPVSRRCPLCLTVCRAKHRLLAHIEAFHPADPRIQLLQCSFNECRLKFLDLSEFQSHINEHRVGDRLPCAYCTRVFKRQRLLDTHLRTVHAQVVVEGSDTKSSPPRSTLRCEGCSKTFRSERTFLLHMVQSQSCAGQQKDKL